MELTPRLSQSDNRSCEFSLKDGGFCSNFSKSAAGKRKYFYFFNRLYKSCFLRHFSLACGVAAAELRQQGFRGVWLKEVHIFFWICLEVGSHCKDSVLFLAWK